MSRPLHQSPYRLPFVNVEVVHDDHLSRRESWQEHVPQPREERRPIIAPSSTIGATSPAGVSAATSVVARGRAVRPSPPWGAGMERHHARARPGLVHEHRPLGGHARHRLAPCCPRRFVALGGYERLFFTVQRTRANAPHIVAALTRRPVAAHRSQYAASVASGCAASCATRTALKYDRGRGRTARFVLRVPCLANRRDEAEVRTQKIRWSYLVVYSAWVLYLRCIFFAFQYGKVAGVQGFEPQPPDSEFGVASFLAVASRLFLRSNRRKSGKIVHCRCSMFIPVGVVAGRSRTGTRGVTGCISVACNDKRHLLHTLSLVNRF